MAGAPSFTDGWVIDRTLFDHAALEQCDCCGGGIAMMASSPLVLELCTDLDTDDRRKDAQALAPFPACMKAEIDRDRLTTRLRLKDTLPWYQAFVASSLESFAAWWATVPLARKQSICVMPVAEVPVLYAMQLDVRGAYSTLLAALLEQVRRFRETGYAHDGATEPEVAFEQALAVKRGAFVLAPEYLESTTCVRELLGFVGGAKLLLPHSKRGADGSTSRSTGSTEAATSGFRGDRRLIRLVIARYLVHCAIRQFDKAGAGESV